MKQLEVGPDPAEVGRARRWVRAQFGRGQPCPVRPGPAETDTLVLLVSELVTNAVVHTASARVVCELRYLPAGLRISVQDQGHQPCGPRLGRGADDEHGRGLLLVDSLSSAWGAHDAGDGSGRIVWAELPHGTEHSC